MALLRGRGKLQQATQTLVDFLTVFQADVEGWLELGDLYIAQQQPKQARNYPPTPTPTPPTPWDSPILPFPLPLSLFLVEAGRGPSSGSLALTCAGSAAPIGLTF